MLCHGKPLLCGKKVKTSILTDGNESEGEDMYGFLPKKTNLLPRTAVRRENIYEASPRKPVKKVVTFREEPPRVRFIQRRHSCAENFRNYAAAKYNYRPLIPVERLPSYPNSGAGTDSQTSSILISSVPPESVCGHYRRRPLLPPPNVKSLSPLPSLGRPRPPCYHVAVRRAASFSASRGMNRNWTVRKPPSPALLVPERAETPSSISIPEPMPLLNRHLSSSTSDLYVDSFALKRSQSRDLSVSSSASSVSEATVYRKIGPSDYVSVNGKPVRKNFRSSMESSSDDGVDVSFRSSVASSTVFIKIFLSFF